MATTTRQLFDLAVQHHQSGRFAEAERLYRQVLAQQPKNVDAMHNLGVLAQQAGRIDIAVDLIGRAIALRPNFPEAYSNLGNALKDLGQFDSAIAAYRQAIALRPNYAEAHYHLGNALKDKGKLDEATATYREAIGFGPDFAEAHNNLAGALVERGQLDEALASARRAIALRPNYAEAHSNLGNALRGKGEFEGAIAAHRQAIAFSPNLPEAHNNLGNILTVKGQLDEAIAAYREAINFRPDFAEAHNNLAGVLVERGQLDEALSSARRAIALRPNYAEAHSNLGNALRGKGEFEGAIAAHRQAIALGPNLPEAHNNLGNALRAKGQLDEAIAAYRQAIKLKPSFAEAHSNLGTALKDQGGLDQAIAAYRQAVSLRRDFARAHSNLVYAVHFHPAFSAEAIAQEGRQWNCQHAQNLNVLGGHASTGSGQAHSTGSRPAHSNQRAPDRRLRIGYVSPDFREHCQCLFTVPVLSHHDHGAFEIFCYSSARQPDEYTRQIAGYVDHWRDARSLDDQALCDLIRADGIDLLVDLTMHMADNRLLVFARKPAPVQVTWLAYPGSTGLTAIDYRLSDPYLDPPELDPPGTDESVYSEQTVRLPDTFWCYDPLDCRDILVNSLPALERGFITFGCLNNFCKISDDVLVRWARVMQLVEGARLLMLTHPGSHRQRAVDRLGLEGIAPQRIEFVSPQPRRGYLEQYHRIDIGLDSFPYNGHTTSLDSMWMGVPVVTLMGQTVVSRAGWSQLSNLGLTELAARTPDQFIQIAVALARDLPRLNALRSTLRQRMEQSALMDAPRFARNIESAYRQMWRTWCEKPLV